MDDEKPPDDLWTVPRAAKFLKIDPTLVRRYCRQGRLKARRAGRDWLVSRIEVEGFALVLKTHRPGRPKKDKEMEALCRRYRLPNDIRITPEERESIRENIAWFARLTPDRRWSATEEANRFDEELRHAGRQAA